MRCASRSASSSFSYVGLLGTWAWSWIFLLVIRLSYLIVSRTPRQIAAVNGGSWVAVPGSAELVRMIG